MKTVGPSVTGRYFGSTTVSDKEDNGAWKVTVDMVEKIKLDNDEWITEVISASCSHDDFDKAYDVAMNSVLEQLNDKLALSNGRGILSNELYDKAQEVPEVSETTEEHITPGKE